MDNDTALDHEGRIAALETKWEAVNGDIQEIKTKLDELLNLKHKGMGALWLVSLLVGSGMLGLVAFVFSLFKSQPHL